MICKDIEFSVGKIGLGKEKIGRTMWCAADRAFTADEIKRELKEKIEAFFGESVKTKSN